MPPKPDAIFFDLDGTLTDPYSGITGCIRFALMELGLPTPPASELRWCIGPPLRDSFVQLSDESMADRAVELYRQRFAETGLYENSVYPGINDLLFKIKSIGIELNVASSKPLVYVERILAHFELTSLFSQVFGSQLSGALSDKAELLAHALRETGHIGAQCVMVGDRKHDAIGARANALQSWGVTWGYAADGELMAAGVEQLFDAPEQIGVWLESSG